MTASVSNGGARLAQKAGFRVLNGTNGDDQLVGTAGNDFIIPLLGHDQVDGGAGFDTLVIDYSAVAPDYPVSSSIVSAGGSFSGFVSASGAQHSVSFANIENLVVAFDDGDNHVHLDGAALAGRALVTLDGNGGIDTLVADFSALAGPTLFRVLGNGIVATNRGSYSGFENFELTLGSGADRVALGAGDDIVYGGGGNDSLDGGAGNDTLVGGAGRNILSGGAGDDVLVSTRADTVRGGSGDDTWVGIFDDSSQSLTFAFNGSTGVGALSNGAALTGIENLDIKTGSGDDSFTLTDVRGSVFIDAGSGTDSLTVITSGSNEFLPFHFSTVGSDGAGGLAGDVAGSDLGFTAFSGIDHLTYTAGDDEDQIFVDVAALAGGATLWIDAAGGSDKLVLDLLAFAETTFIVAPDGSISGNVPGTYLNFESYWITLGDGTNVVTTGSGDDWIEGGSGDDTLAAGDGDDWIRAGAGVNVIDGGGGSDWITSRGLDTIDGGDGFDTWQGDYGLTTEDLTVAIVAGAGTVSNGVTFVSVENATVVTGSGDDWITVTGPWIVTIDAREGIDTLTVDHSTSEAGGASVISSSEGSFFGSLDSSDAATYFAGIEHLTYIASDGDDLIILDAAALASGATLSVDGAGGNDRLEVDFTAFGDIHFEADNAGNVTSNVGSFDSFESFLVRAGAGNDHIVTASGNDTLLGGGGTNWLSSGAGDDVIASEGVDLVDGGDGFDSWQGVYAEATSDLVFTFDGTSATLSNGTQLTNVELVELSTGSGDDVVNISGTAYGSFSCGTGTDSFNADFSGTEPNEVPDTTQVWVFLGELSGIVNGLSTFYGFDNVNIVASDGDSRLYLDMREALSGSTLALDGGLGMDTLWLDVYFPSDDLVFTVEGDGSVSNNLGISISNIENFRLAFGSGHDIITTGAGDDFIFGGDGDDVLVGGAGSDDLYGGAGADTFLFLTLDDFAQGIPLDAIMDFSSAEGDRIDLSEIDADAGILGDQAFTFIGDSAFTGNGSGGELRYETDGYRSLVQGDIDGDGVADFTLFLLDVQSLTAADFVL